MISILEFHDFGKTFDYNDWDCRYFYKVNTSILTIWILLSFGHSILFEKGNIILIISTKAFSSSLGIILCYNVRCCGSSEIDLRCNH